MQPSGTSESQDAVPSPNPSQPPNEPGAEPYIAYVEKLFCFENPMKEMFEDGEDERSKCGDKSVPCKCRGEDCDCFLSNTSFIKFLRYLGGAHYAAYIESIPAGGPLTEEQKKAGVVKVLTLQQKRGRLTRVLKAISKYKPRSNKSVGRNSDICYYDQSWLKDEARKDM